MYNPPSGPDYYRAATNRGPGTISMLKVERVDCKRAGDHRGGGVSSMSPQDAQARYFVGHMEPCRGCHACVIALIWDEAHEENAKRSKKS